MSRFGSPDLHDGRRVGLGVQDEELAGRRAVDGDVGAAVAEVVGRGGDVEVDLAEVDRVRLVRDAALDRPVAGVGVVDGQLGLARPVVVARHREVARPAEVDQGAPRGALLEAPGAVGRPEGRDVGVAVAVEVRLHGDVEVGRPEGGQRPGPVGVADAEQGVVGPERGDPGLALQVVVPQDAEDRQRDRRAVGPVVAGDVAGAGLERRAAVVEVVGQLGRVAPVGADQRGGHDRPVGGGQVDQRAGGGGPDEMGLAGGDGEVPRPAARAVLVGRRDGQRRRDGRGPWSGSPGSAGRSARCCRRRRGPWPRRRRCPGAGRPGTGSRRGW